MGAGSHKIRFALQQAILVGTLCVCAPAIAQVGEEELPAVSRAVVQQLPSQGGYQLNAALSRLAANPRDVSALIDAGNAALMLGDTEAALGFYGRADQLAPGNAQVKSALAMAMVRNEDPFAAIPLFDAAERAGASALQLAADRGLAYDLVGDNATAQRFYRQALGMTANDELARRLALSLAIAGDRKNSEAALAPQLNRNDRAAWRTRAFALAILGDTEEAVRIATRTMPAELSSAVIPYLRYMGRLTPAQQAAAANFGHFPRAAQIGRDDPRVARYAALNPRKPVAALSAKAESAPAKTKSRRERKRKDQLGARGEVLAKQTAAPPAAVRARPAVSSSPPVAAPVRVSPPPVRVAAATPNPSLGASRPATPPVPQGAPPQPAFAALSLPVAGATATPTASAGTSPPPAIRQPPAAPIADAPSSTAGSQLGIAPLPTAVSATGQSNLDLARMAQQSGAPAVPAGATPQPTTPAAVQPRRDLAAAFSDFRPPEEESRPAAIAVDLSQLPKPRARAAEEQVERGPVPDAPKGTKRSTVSDPATSTAPSKGSKAGKPGDKAATKTPAKPEKPSHPSRIWVQSGVGRDKAALGFDWRKYQRTQAELFKGKKAWTTPWGQTNRLLIGPFDSQAAAQAFLKDLKKKDLDGFVWTSPAGQAVDALPAK